MPSHSQIAFRLIIAINEICVFCERVLRFHSFQNINFEIICQRKQVISKQLVKAVTNRECAKQSAKELSGIMFKLKYNFISTSKPCPEVAKMKN